MTSRGNPYADYETPVSLAAVRGLAMEQTTLRTRRVHKEIPERSQVTAHGSRPQS